MQGGEIELLRQPSRCLMYVGEIQTIGAGQIGVVSMTYLRSRRGRLDHGITWFNGFGHRTYGTYLHRVR
jgi:hypothetical protein